MEHHSWGHSYLRTYFRLLQGEDARLRSCEGESVKLRSRSSKSAKMQFLSIYSCNKKQHMGQTIKSRKSFEFFLVSCNEKEFRPHNINISLDFHSSKCQVSWIFMSVLKNGCEIKDSDTILLYKKQCKNKSWFIIQAPLKCRIIFRASAGYPLFFNDFYSYQQKHIFLQ